MTIALFVTALLTASIVILFSDAFGFLKIRRHLCSDLYEDNAKYAVCLLANTLMFGGEPFLLGFAYQPHSGFLICQDAGMVVLVMAL